MSDRRYQVLLAEDAFGNSHAISIVGDPTGGWGHGQGRYALCGITCIRQLGYGHWDPLVTCKICLDKISEWAARQVAESTPP